MQSGWKAGLVFLAAAAPVFGDLAAFSPNGVEVESSDSGVNLGMVFTPLSNIRVTELGYYNIKAISNPETVDLFDSSGHVLANVDVTPGAVDGYYFATIPSVLLTAGATYTVSSYAPDGYGYSYAAPPVVNSGINFVGTTYLYASGVAFPNQNYAPVKAYYGPNFEFTTATPEPGYFALIAAGFTIAALVRLRASRTRVSRTSSAA